MANSAPQRSPSIGGAPGLKLRDPYLGMRETHAWTQDRARARETNHVCLEALSLSRTSVVSVDTPAISSFFSLPYLGGGCKCL